MKYQDSLEVPLRPGFPIYLFIFLPVDWHGMPFRLASARVEGLVLFNCWYALGPETFFKFLMLKDCAYCRV